jgi:hypothetical protein
MTRRPSGFRSILLVSVCTLLAVALTGLWWRSGATVDTLAWTTGRPDPAIAATELPARWRMLGGLKYDAAARTFSISSEGGQLILQRQLHLRRAGHTVSLFGDVTVQDMPMPIAPYPFADEPGVLCRYSRSLPFAPVPMRFAGFDATEIEAATMFQSGLPGQDWDWRGWSIAMPHWGPIALLLLPGVWLLVDHFLRRRRVQAGLCNTCGYDLRASPGRCPECGTPAALDTSPQ